MRIAKLELLAFGPFRGHVLDLSKEGLHVVFGRNEAGKSTTLRAITGLLYGIDRQTRDTHVHKATELRIGGVLVAGGEELAIVRRKGNTNTLLDPAGNALDEALLRRFLGGVSEETFLHAFGLDHAALAAGAEALLEGKGDLGESLFDASVGGGGDVQRVLGELTAQADAIWRPRGSTLPLNEALKSFADAQKAVKERQMLPEAYTTQEEALAKAQSDRAEVMKRRAALGQRKTLLERAKMRVPLERRRTRLLTARSELGAMAEAFPRVLPLRVRLATHAAEREEKREGEAELARLGRNIEDAARLAAVSADVALLPALRLDARKEGRLQRALTERTNLASRLATAKTELARAVRELSRLRAEEGAHPLAGEDDHVLVLALERARALGDVDTRLASERSRAKRRREELDGKAASLAAAVPLDALVRLPVPSVESVAHVAARGAETDRKLTHATARRSDLDAELATVERQIAEQSGDFAPPDAATLERSRRERDALAGKIAQAAERDERLALVAALDRATRAADAVADRMIVEADRVTGLARLRSSATTLTRQREELVAEVLRLEAEKSALGAELVALFAPTGVIPRSDGEMRSWLERHAQIVDAHASLVTSERDVADAESVAQATADALARALGAPESAPLPTRIAEAARRVQANAEARRVREASAKARAKLEADVDERGASIAMDEEAFASVSASLAEILAPLGIAEDAAQEEIARALEALRALFGLVDKRTELGARIALVGSEIASFEADIERLAAEVAPDLVALPKHEAASALVARAEGAERTMRDLEAVSAQLAEIGESAIPEDVATLAEDPATMDRALDEADQALEALDGELRSLDQNIGRTRLGLEQLRGDSFAAEAAASAQEALARIREHAERWARAKLASVVLAREIERYREENQGPLLAAASTLFARLTLGAFAGIKAGFDERDRPCLRCVRAGGSEVEVTGLSEGTRDQLYLALRLASLLRRADMAEPMPLVLDDVLVQVDDERAAAALAVLAEMAKRMQIVFFTHHARLVELARKSVPSADLVVHELPARESVTVASADLPAG